MDFSRRSVSPVVATAILLVVAVVGVVGFQTWFGSFSSGVLAGVEEDSTTSLQGTNIEAIMEDQLYFSNGNSGNVTIVSVKIGDKLCNLSNLSVGTSVQNFSLKNCTQNLTDGFYEVIIVTDEEIISRYLKVNGLVLGPSNCILDSLPVAHGNNGTFYNSTLVPFGSSCSSEVRTCTDGFFSGNSTYNYSSCSVAEQDVIPNAFNFSNQTSVNLNTLITSNLVIPTGYDGPLAVSVIGNGSPQLRVNGGVWTTSTTINPSQTLEIRLTSSNSYNNWSVVNLTLGNYSTFWGVQTRAQDTTPNAFSFTDQTGVNLNTLTTSNSITPTGYDGPLAVSVSGSGSPQISVNGGGWTTSTTINPGQTLQVRLTSSGSYTTLRQATVTLGTVSDVWDVTTGSICVLGEFVSCTAAMGSCSGLSGLYNINPDASGAFQVYCDMTTDGGGWQLFANVRNFQAIPELNLVQQGTTYGALRADRWLKLRNRASYGNSAIMTIDGSNRVSKISMTKLNAANCIALSSISNLSAVAYIFSHEGVGCSQNQAGSTMILYMFNQLVNDHATVKFDTWPYGSNSPGQQTDMDYYIR